MKKYHPGPEMFLCTKITCLVNSVSGWINYLNVLLEFRSKSLGSMACNLLVKWDVLRL